MLIIFLALLALHFTLKLILILSFRLLYGICIITGVNKSERKTDFFSELYDFHLLQNLAMELIGSGRKYICVKNTNSANMRT